VYKKKKFVAEGGLPKGQNNGFTRQQEKAAGKNLGEGARGLQKSSKTLKKGKKSIT